MGADSKLDFDLDASVALLTTPLVQTLLGTHPNDLALISEEPNSSSEDSGSCRDISGEKSNRVSSSSYSRPQPFCTPWWKAWTQTPPASPSSESASPGSEYEFDNEVDPEGRGTRWAQVLAYYLRVNLSSEEKHGKGKGKATEDRDADIPPELRALIDELCALSLRRDPIHLPSDPPIRLSTRGMSPKKAHEVTQTLAFVSMLLRSCSIDPRTVRIVDVGAGQGYLTRALSTHLSPPHVLALDASEVQTAGAQRWEARFGFNNIDRTPEGGTGGQGGGITQRTIHVTPETLCATVDEWVRETSTSTATSESASTAGSGETSATTHGEESREPVPVLLVALHACGSLTPDILRAFVAQRRRVCAAVASPPVHNSAVSPSISVPASSSTSTSSQPLWAPLAVLAVGCCYNLLAPQDFPLSTHLRTPPPAGSSPPSPATTTATHPAQPRAPKQPAQQSQSPQPVESPSSLTLPASAYHLAAQIPAHWARTPQAQREMALAVRKVIWRAVVGRRVARLQRARGEGAGDEGPVDGNSHPDEDGVVGMEERDGGQRPRPQVTLGFAGGITQTGTGTGDKPVMRRLGRLNDAVYKDWGSFVRATGEKLGFLRDGETSPGAEDVNGMVKGQENGVGVIDENRNAMTQRTETETSITAPLSKAERRLMSELGVLHVLRCIVGPLVESVIIADRAVWMREQLQAAEPGDGEDGTQMDVGTVNLFDQATGSGRNVALVVAPRSSQPNIPS